MSNIQNARDEVRRLRRYAQQKVSRLRRNSGAELAGTQYDPIRPLERVKRYNTKQLEAYKKELQGFLSRKRQFVGGDDGTPLPAEKWREYKQLEKRHNEGIRVFYGRYKDLILPNNEPIWSKMNRSVPDHRYMRNDYSNTPYDPIVREHGNIRNEKALDKLIEKAHEREAEGDWSENKAKLGRSNFGKMVDFVGDKELEDCVSKLSDEQWNVLWFYTDFARDFSFNYEYAKLLFEDPEYGDKHAFISRRNERSRQNALEWVEWVESQKL